MTGLESNDLAIRLQRELQPYLQPGERILWSAMPDASRFWMPFLIWLFAIPWTAFTLFWISLAAMGVWPLVQKGDWLALGFPAFGLIFLVVGIGMLIKPFTMRADARYSLYAITDRNAVHYTHRRKPIVRLMPLDKTGGVKCSAKADGWGTLSIDTGSELDEDGSRRTTRIFIQSVPDIARVERILLDARARLTASRSPEGADPAA